jgi:hypothetical protein
MINRYSPNFANINGLFANINTGLIILMGCCWFDLEPPNLSSLDPVQGAIPVNQAAEPLRSEGPDVVSWSEVLDLPTTMRLYMHYSRHLGYLHTYIT